MGGSGSRSAQELHRSPPCTRFQCLEPARRQPRPAMGSPKTRPWPPKGPPQHQQQGRGSPVAVGRLRAGCETSQGSGDVPWPAAGGQRGDGPLLWKAAAEEARLTAVKQRVDKPAPVARPRPEAPGAARKGASQAVGYVLERWPPPPPLEPPPPAAPAAPAAPGPQRRGCRDASASYAGSSTSSRSSLAPDDSGISSSPSRVSQECHHNDCEGEVFVKPRSPRPPPWKVRSFHGDQIPTDLHRRFCEEIQSRYQLQTEEDRRRRLLAIRRIDTLVSQRMAHSLGREVPPPHRSLQRGAKSGEKGGEGANSSQLRSSSAAQGKSGNSESRKSAHSGRDDVTEIRRRALLVQYPNSCTDRLQQQAQAEINRYRNLNDAIVRQLHENYALENSGEQRRICDFFSKKLTMKTDKDDTHKTNTYLKEMKEERMHMDKGDMPNEYGNARGQKESINITLEPSEIQRTFIRSSKRYGQNEKRGTIVDEWYDERLRRQEENEPHSILLQAGQWVQNNIRDHEARTPQRDPQQSDSRSAQEGAALVQKYARSDTAGSALLSKDNMVMQLLLGGYFKHDHFQPCWPRVGAVRRTTNQLDVSIHSCREPVEKHSVETQTLPVHVSRRLPHSDEPRAQPAPKIEIDHRGGLTRYYSLGRECSVGSLASTSGTPGSPRRQPSAGDARQPDEERRPSYLLPEMPPPPPLPPPPPPQRIHSDLSPRGNVPSVQWISPTSSFTSPHKNRHSAMPQPLASHMNGNSTSQGLTRGLTLKPEAEVDNGSHRRNIVSKSTVAKNSIDQDKEDYEAEENEQGKNYVWSGQISRMSHSTLHQPSANEARVGTAHLLSGKKNNVENTNETHRLAFSDRRPLASEEELRYTSVNTSNQYNRRVSLDYPHAFLLVDEGRRLQYSTPNANGDEVHNSVECWGEEETKEKPEHGTEKTRKRFGPRHPRHSRHHRDSSRTAKQEEKFAESDSGSEERIIERNVGLQSLRRVVEKTDLTIGCRGKDSFDTLDNVLLSNVRSDSKGGGRSQFIHSATSKRVIEEKVEEETSDDTHLLVGSTEQSSDSITRSSTSVLCPCCREQVQSASFHQCKFIPDRKKLQMRDSRRSVDQSPSWATQKKPSVTVVRNADSRTKGSPYESNDLDDEEISHCRSTCCCNCHRPQRQPRFQPDVPGRQAAHAAKRCQCSGTAPAPDAPCCCRDQQSAECGLCAACRRSGGDGPLSDRRSFHECYCGSRRVCYSILEDEEEAAAEEALPGGRGFARAHSRCRNREWAQ